MLKYYLTLHFICSFFNYAEACFPNEIHIREQWINAYVKSDGTKIATHKRSEHCREIEILNYFSNKTQKNISGLNVKYKHWQDSEKKLLSKEIDNLPIWLRKYKLAEILRASFQEQNPDNPALTIPSLKILIVFDNFFKMKNKRSIIIHEMSHLAIWDIDPEQLKTFLMSNGWIYQKGKPPLPPQKLLLPDSAESPSEDFANHVENYYENPEKIKQFNMNSFNILKAIISNKENL